MMRRIAMYAIVLAMIVVGLMLGLDIMYLLRGSLEEFPTEEQIYKVRTVTTVLAVMLIAIEVALCSLLLRLKRAPRA